MDEAKIEKKRVVVSIFEQEYVVRSHEEEEHIQRLASFLDQKMKEIRKKSPQMTTANVAVLTALNLTNDLFKVKAEYEDLVALIEETKKC